MALAQFPDLPYQAIAAGLRTEYGVSIPTGSRVIYLRSTGLQDGDDGNFNNRLTLSLSAALAQCRADRGDVILVFPGHSETIGASTLTWVSGVRIVGVGDPRQDTAPTFNWNATTSKMAVSAKNVTLSNLRLTMDGANGVVKALEVTAAGFTLDNCFVRFASGAALKATIAIELGEGASEATIRNCRFSGTETHNATDVIKCVGSSAPNNGLRVVDNEFFGSVTAGNGFVHVTTASLRIRIARNVMYNTHTASTSCITIDNVAADGLIDYNMLATKSTGAQVSGTNGIAFAGASVLAQCFENRSANDKQTSGMLLPTVDT